MQTPDVNQWIEDIKAQPEAAGIGMILAHRGIVRSHTRAGDPVSEMVLGVDRERMATAVEEALTWDGIIAVRAWINEGLLKVGDDIMSVVVAGDIRDNVFDGLARLVKILKTEVVTEDERP